MSSIQVHLSIWSSRGCQKNVLKSLEKHDFESANKDTLIQWLAEKEITRARHQKIIIEGALI